MVQSIETEVHAYSGMAYADRPRAFFWEAQEIAVLEVQAALRTPSGKSFRVLAEDKKLYLLNYDETSESWFVKQL